MIEVDLIKAQEALTPVALSVDSTLRAKITDACGLACVFCHNEGTPVESSEQFLSFPTRGSRVSIYAETNGVQFMPGKMKPDDQYRSALGVCRDALGFDELHLTGGEPTLNRDVAELAGIATGMGYRVKLTSNGETGDEPIGALAAAGVVKINFSVFGTTAQELADVQHERFKNSVFGQRKIDALEKAVDACAATGIGADMNLVIRGTNDFSRADRLIETYGDKATIRLLNDLASPASTEAIYEFLATLNAVPVLRKFTAGSSNTRTVFEVPGVSNPVQFKKIRRTRLPGTCDDCRFDQECDEGYYGVRLYIDKLGAYLLGVCLRRMDLTIGINGFMDSDRPAAIKHYKAADMLELVREFGELVLPEVPGRAQ